MLTIYYPTIRRNKIYEIALGTGVGLTQDALPPGTIETTGISKCVVGYLAAAASIRVDVEQLRAHYVLTAIMVTIHSLILAGLHGLAFQTPPPLLPWSLPQRW